MSAGDVLSNDARSDIMVEGIICTEAAFRINTRLRAKKFLSLSNCLQALMP